MSGKILNKAKSIKDDEFYTQWKDIEKEIENYKDYLKGKSIYCNCDDPRKSNFFKYFKYNFEELGLSKLVATYYDIIETPILTEMTKHGIVSKPMIGNGDFRSDECMSILKDCDIVITNPPFSLFREYIDTLLKHDKLMLIISAIHALTYANVFSYIKDNRVWTGYNSPKYFLRPSGSLGSQTTEWFTNIKISKRHDYIELHEVYRQDKYPTYDNYDAININKVKDIPKDYTGKMGVPITFMLKYNPEQFNIIGMDRSLLTLFSSKQRGRFCIGGKRLFARVIVTIK